MPRRNWKGSQGENQAQGINGRRQQVMERQTDRTEEYRGTRRQGENWGRQRAGRRSISTLDELLRAKSDSINNQYASIAEIKDPVARKLLRQMIKEEQNHELRLAKVIDFLDSDPGSVAKLLKQLELTLGSNKAKGFTTGLITAVAVAALLPSTQKNLKPLLLALVKGFNDVSEKARDLVSDVKESVEDIIAQAQFERLQDSIDQSISEKSPQPEI